MAIPSEDLAYLKQVSRVKHRILREYLVPWTRILGSSYGRLAYVDCFAGPGTYQDGKGQPLPGSPVIALDLAKQYALKYPGHSLVLGFVEKDHDTAERLKATLRRVPDLPESVKYSVEEENAQDFVERLISLVKESRSGSIIPTFFFVDPYGHPISIPIMSKLLSLGKTEILVNLMWFSMAMHLENPKEEAAIDRLFEHGRWQTFKGLQGRDKETAFVQYFANEVGAKYWLPFAVPFGPQDHVPGGETRTKYYLIHFSSHPKAALLMKEVMWRAREDLEQILLGPQLRLFGGTPDLQDLRSRLLERFSGREISFDDMRVETLEWVYVEKHYRGVLKSMEGQEVTIERVQSRRTGLAGRDKVIFR